MEEAKKIEIIICEYYLPSIVSILLGVGIKNYNVIPNLSGECGIDVHEDEKLSEKYTNCLVVVLGNYEQFRLLMDPLKELMKKNGGICMISDVEKLTV